MCDLTVVILDERDTDRLLKLLYNGKRPSKVHTLACACGSTANLRTSKKAWNGWQVLPFAKCPTCLQKPATQSTIESGYCGPAAGKFEKMVEAFMKGEL